MPTRSALTRLLLVTCGALLLAPGVAGAAVLATPSMSTARTQASATSLPAGGTASSVLVAGGFNGTATDPVRTTERYDVASGTWSTGPTMNANHGGHHALLLPDGRVMVVGGVGIRGTYSRQPELFDPSAGTWTNAATQGTGRTQDTATVVNFRSGPRVIVAGGQTPTPVTLASVEAYDVANNQWITTPSMSLERRGHAAVALPDGRLLVAGGYNANNGLLATTELYDPNANTWTAGPTMASPRADFSLTVVDGTHVLAAGGVTSGGDAAASSEVLDPTGLPGSSWQNAGTMAVARSGHQATLVRDGFLVVTGGRNNAGPGGLDSAESWTPTNGWGGPYATPGSTSIGGARLNHAAAAIPQSDEVLVAGGGSVPDTVTTTAARWTPDRPAVAPTTPTSPIITPVVTPVIVPQQTPVVLTPVQGRTVVAQPASGNVYVRIGKTDEYRLLTQDEALPVGTVLDTSEGKVLIVANVGGETQSARFWGGTFRVGQTTKKSGYVEIRLFGKPKCQPSKKRTTASTKGKKSAVASAAKKKTKKKKKSAKRKRKPRAWGDGKGKFRTRGAHSSASVRGTKWLVEERCAGTYTRVKRGKVRVRDFEKHKSLTLKAPKSYLARARRR